MRFIELKIGAVYQGADGSQRQVLGICENRDIHIKVITIPPGPGLTFPVGHERTVQRPTFMRWAKRGDDGAPLEVVDGK